MRVASAIIILAAGALLAADLGRETATDTMAAVHAAPLGRARISLRLVGDRLRVVGTSASASHEAALRRLVAAQLPDFETRLDFSPGILAASYWERASLRLVDVVAAMESAEAIMEPRRVRLRGVTATPEAVARRIETLRDALPGDVEISSDVLVVPSGESLDALCRKTFAATVREPISFALSSSDIRPASAATLDRITDFANDCPSLAVVITGHTDSSGNESWNLRLSRARAQAVADRIAANGIDPARLTVTGAGSAEPIADNSTPYGRELNRRIEFDLRLDQGESDGPSRPNNSTSKTRVAPGGMTLPAPRLP